MKHLLAIILLCPFLSMGQLTDTTCIQSRWIAIKPNEINKDIFLLDSLNDETLDLVFVIKKLVEESKINIYNQTNNRWRLGEKDWYYISYKEELRRNLKDSAVINKDPYFQELVYSKEPIFNENGEPKHFLNQLTGFEEVRFPPPETHVFPSKECDEIRIKESRIYNESTKKYEFIPIGLSFYFKEKRMDYAEIIRNSSWVDLVSDYAIIIFGEGESDTWEGRGHEKFWVNLNELFEVLDDKSKYPWYEAIVNKKYHGFQYMQTSCDDDGIKY